MKKNVTQFHAFANELKTQVEAASVKALSSSPKISMDGGMLGRRSDLENSWWRVDVEPAVGAYLESVTRPWSKFGDGGVGVGLFLPAELSYIQPTILVRCNDESADSILNLVMELRDGRLGLARDSHSDATAICLRTAAGYHFFPMSHMGNVSVDTLYFQGVLGSSDRELVAFFDEGGHAVDAQCARVPSVSSESTVHLREPVSVLQARYVVTTDIATVFG